MTRAHLRPYTRERKKDLLIKALHLAEKMHYSHVTYSSLAKYANVSTQLIRYYFSSNYALQNAVLKQALKDRNLTIITQGLSMSNPLICKKLEPDLLPRIFNLIKEKL
jgi:AcrR family transcriptional regulator